MQDTFRSFTGAEKHKKLTHISDSVKDAKVVRNELSKLGHARHPCKECSPSKAFKSIHS